MRNLTRSRLALASALIAALAAVIGLAFARVPAAPVRAAASTSDQGQSLCIAHHPQGDVWYTRGCTGHDEPELDPLSTHPGSAQDITWTIMLPSNGSSTLVDSVGPTFWIGGTVTDPNSLFGQAFLELQFYPNSLVLSFR